jgi:putative nucleotidyltransferase with HDIG domain
MTDPDASDLEEALDDMEMGPDGILQASRSWKAIESLSTQLSSIAGADDLADRLLRGLCDLLAADNGSVLMLDKEGENLRIVANIGLPDGALTQPVPVGNSVSGIVMFVGQPLLLRGRMPDQCPQQRAVKSSLIVPIRYRGESFGVVSLNRLPHRPSFDDNDLDAAARVVGTFSPILTSVDVEEESAADELAPVANQALTQTIQALAQTIEAKDPYTRGHCDRVRQYACDIAAQMGLERSFCDQLAMGAALHDIGKIGVPESVLTKPSKLTNEEYDAIKRHPVVGAEIVRPLGLPETAQSAILHHHERFDGTGYPAGLKGRAIPLSARILAVADAFDAMTITRAYRGAMTVSYALDEMKRWAGRQFDPVIVAVFVRLCQEQHLAERLQSIETARNGSDSAATETSASDADAAKASGAV